MKVIQLIGGLDLKGGGPQHALLLLNKYLNKKGIDSVIFTTNSGYAKNLKVPLRKIFIYQDTKTIFYFYPDFFLLRKFSKLYYSGIYGSDLFIGLFKNIKNYNIIHIHGIFSFLEIFGSTFSFYFKKPYIITPLGSLSPELIKKRSKILKNMYLTLFGKRIFKKSSGIHCRTNYEKKEIEKLDFGLEEKIFVLPNGIEISQFEKFDNEVFKKYSSLKDKKYILFLSRINWKKGLDILIPAFSEISKIYKDIYLVIAGPDEEKYGEKVRKWINDYKIPSEKIIFKGPLYNEEKIAILKNAQIFVLPSYSENFGIVVVEAMAAGVPVVISNKVGIYEEVKKNEAGIITDTSIESVYKGIKMLIENENLRKKISENAKKLVKNEYDIEKVAEKMVKVYQSILRK